MDRFEDRPKIFVAFQGEAREILPCTEDEVTIVHFVVAEVHQRETKKNLMKQNSLARHYWHQHSAEACTYGT